MNEKNACMCFARRQFLFCSFHFVSLFSTFVAWEIIGLLHVFLIRFIFHLSSSSSSPSSPRRWKNENKKTYTFFISLSLILFLHWFVCVRSVCAQSQSSSPLSITIIIAAQAQLSFATNVFAQCTHTHIAFTALSAHGLTPTFTAMRRTNCEIFPFRSFIEASVCGSEKNWTEMVAESLRPLGIET